MRTVATVITVIGLGFAGLFLWIIMMLGKHQQFYGVYIPAITIGVIIIMVLGIYGQWKERLVKISSLSFIIISFVVVIGFEGYQSYLKSLEIVSTQDFDLGEYQPFEVGTKLVQLEGQSNYKITDDLPVIDGATALYPVYASFAQAVYPKKTYSIEESEVRSSQTSGAFMKLINDVVDIAVIAEPSKEQYQMAKELDKELKLTPIGKEAFVFFVNQRNPIDSLTIEEIQAIYTGAITNWKEVGGNDAEIRAFQRPEGSGSQSALVRFMDGATIMDPPADEIISGMGGIIRETSNYQNHRNAIGYSFRYFSQEMVEDRRIKYIAVNGIAPTKENIQNGSYPIVADFFAITAGSSNPNIPPFIEWMQSEQGQQIVDRSGYVRVK
ncbi:PstS family phosphate ABC transporter substrate-binding protein [Gracilibacillus xinjiangensis]|uniref:Substrate-binding domain-containing protein n=1 Tax=Gracilibacillus xinjiangensis TaxID=1193282 RepID=A0ABV8X2U8_9BACI